MLLGRLVMTALRSALTAASLGSTATDAEICGFDKPDPGPWCSSFSWAPGLGSVVSCVPGEFSTAL